MAGEIHVYGPFQRRLDGCPTIGRWGMYCMLEYFDFCDEFEPALQADISLKNDRRIAADCGTLSFVGCTPHTLKLLHKLLVAAAHPRHPFWNHREDKFAHEIIELEGEIDLAGKAEQLSNHEEYRKSFRIVADAIDDRLQSLFSNDRFIPLN